MSKLSGKGIEISGATINVTTTGNEVGVSVPGDADFTITGSGAISLTNSGTGAAIEAGEYYRLQRYAHYDGRHK